jgi:hypothetical protein
VYGLPEDIDLSFLEGTTLIQVAIGEHEVILNLHPGVSIMAQSTVRLSDPTGPFRTFDDPRAAGAATLTLLGADIAGVAGSTDGTLSIRRQSGWTLEISDDSEADESYTITHGDRVIVV